MLRDVISSVDYSMAAQVALGLFVVAFSLMIYGTLRLSRSTTDRFASIPLSDRVEDPRDGK
jgi:cytochrome c oxidase cbb3-type subunit 4